jgi:hypothetical protein
MERIFAALSLIFALVFAQIPEVVQQYRQRIGGAADELTVIVRNFDEDSRRSGYDRAGALNLMKKNPERLVREQGQRMDDYTQRLDRLTEQQTALAGGVTVGAVFAVALNYDPQIMSQAWNAYSWAFPTTVTGFIFAIIGWILSYSVLLILGSAVGLRSRATF